MNGPFNVGDVVVCVDDTPANYPDRTYIRRMIPISKGRTYRITTILASPNGQPGRLVNGDGPSIRDDGIAGYRFSRFRHLHKADEQFTAKIRACKPIREGISA